MTGPQSAETDYGALRRETQQAILKAFDVKPWHVGLAPVPWRLKLWHKISFGRRRAARRAAREDW